MPLKVSFNIGDADLQHLADVAMQTQALARGQPQDAVIAAARELLERGLKAQPAEFVKERYARLRTIVDMAVDEDWKLSADDRQRVLNALACFATPAEAPTGVLDHAIMIELVSRDLHHDLESYRDFCEYRQSRAARLSAPGVDRDQQLAQRRAALQTRMHKRRTRELEGASGSLKRFFSLLGI